MAAKGLLDQGKSVDYTNQFAFAICEGEKRDATSIIARANSLPVADRIFKVGKILYAARIEATYKSIHKVEQGAFKIVEFWRIDKFPDGCLARQLNRDSNGVNVLMLPDGRVSIVFVFGGTLPDYMGSWVKGQTVSLNLAAFQNYAGSGLGKHQFEYDGTAQSQTLKWNMTASEADKVTKYDAFQFAANETFNVQNLPLAYDTVKSCIQSH